MTRFYREQFGRASHSVSKREVRANRFGSGHNRICRASLSLPGINNSISFFLPLSALSRQRMIFTPNSRKPHPQDREERVHSFPFDKTTRIVSFLKDSATNGIHGGISYVQGIHGYPSRCILTNCHVHVVPVIHNPGGRSPRDPDHPDRSGATAKSVSGP